MSRMLIADDQDGIRLMLAQVFKNLGIEVDTAEDGLSAWEQLEQSTYDLVLLDMNMPRMFGHEVLRNMRNNDIDTPVMIMTAFGEKSTIEEVRRLGITAQFEKPFDIYGMIEKVKEVLDIQ
ncbi:response regulator receiver protein [Exiguobacterium sp. SH31]|uniref:response regulator n=1 Tax=unclassified Exiguobacterium TaxID=2644629 RepID=UPI0008B431D8|nr:MULTISPECIES: response regulator [unclassified Exiguobacterium]OGX79495.1 response regulator receiver protein [Exiguobacterium sp. SH31]